MGICEIACAFAIMYLRIVILERIQKTITMFEGNYLYDKQEFQYLLKLAMNGRTQKEFAEAAGLSHQHVSRMLSDSYNNPPSLHTLSKIASAADDERVTLDALKKAAGYQTDHSSPQPDYAQRERIATVRLTRQLHELTPEISIPVRSRLERETGFDIACTIEDPAAPIQHWYFELKLYEGAARSVDSLQMYQFFYNVLRTNPEGGVKFSFVTISKSQFDSWIHLDKLHMPDVILSVILLDSRTNKVLSEAYLDTGKAPDPYVLENLTFQQISEKEQKGVER